MTKFYVYTLARPDGSVFYVGKGSGGRMHQHEVNAANGETGPRADAIRAIWDAGHQVVKKTILETEDEGVALAAERYWIAHYFGVLLTNQKPSASGVVVPYEPNPYSERDNLRAEAITALQRLRDEGGVSMERLAEGMDTSVSVVSRWYNGRRVPSYSTSKRILRLAEIVAVALPKVMLRQAA